eukprot:Pompholyxophrys_punicea_v1_NODE_118_length_3370_cov_2.781900.p5 type:complete len:108 gc:universal NODE_118_length_3370_cov_2.781900:1612-1289(-)
MIRTDAGELAVEVVKKKRATCCQVRIQKLRTRYNLFFQSRIKTIRKNRSEHFPVVVQREKRRSITSLNPCNAISQRRQRKLSQHTLGFDCGCDRSQGKISSDKMTGK